MSTHVCLVSAQLIPNVLPVLAERPRQAVLLITPQMENQGRLLEKFFRERGVQASGIVQLSSRLQRRARLRFTRSSLFTPP